MPSKIDEQIEKTKQENQVIKDSDTTDKKDKDSDKGDTTDTDLSKDQKEILDKVEDVSPEEALEENQLPVRMEQKIQVPAYKDSFTSEQEFSQYVSSLFYLYHKGNLDAKSFYQKLSPHFHENFINMLPPEKEAQIETFELLQQAFIKQLSKPIVKYSLTDSQLRERTDEAGFFRKYELENGEFIYYQTILKQTDGRWLLYDDSPAPPYLIIPNHNFKEQERGEINE